MRRKIIGVAYVVLIVIASLWGRRSNGSSQPAPRAPAPCSIIVPSNSGEHAGLGASGMNFKGRAALRVIDELTCGPKSAKNNYSAINRK
jgi:hypothetical protein